MYYLLQMYPIPMFGNFLKSNDSNSIVRKLVSVILEKVLREYTYKLCRTLLYFVISLLTGKHINMNPKNMVLQFCLLVYKL